MRKTNLNLTGSLVAGRPLECSQRFLCNAQVAVVADFLVGPVIMALRYNVLKRLVLLLKGFVRLCLE